jgi:hypothetical protein
VNVGNTAHVPPDLARVGHQHVWLQSIAAHVRGWVPTSGTAPATTNSNTTDTSTLAAGDVNQPGGTTIPVSLDSIEGLSGHAVSAWGLPVGLNEDKDAIGGTSFWNITDDPFSASKKIQPQDEDGFFDVTTGESPIVEPGTYRFIIEAFVPNGAMHYGCEMPIEVDGGEPLVLTVSSLPTFTGPGWHWAAPEQLEYPDCPTESLVHSLLDDADHGRDNGSQSSERQPVGTSGERSGSAVRRFC